MPRTGWFASSGQRPSGPTNPSDGAAVMLKAATSRLPPPRHQVQSARSMALSPEQPATHDAKASAAAAPLRDPGDRLFNACREAPPGPVLLGGVAVCFTRMRASTAPISTAIDAA